MFKFLKPKAPKDAAEAQPAPQATQFVPTPAAAPLAENWQLAELAINAISEGVILLDRAGVVRLLNPEALKMLGYRQAAEVTGLSLVSLAKFEACDGAANMPANLSVAAPANDPVQTALSLAEDVSLKHLCMRNRLGEERQVAVTVVTAQSSGWEKIVTLRDITRELEEEGRQMDFISTASHEMRTPVASIEGYVGLALNPRTATIDERARRFLEEAQRSSRHLGKLLQDLLDTTRLDDGRMKVKLAPVDLVEAVKSIAEGQLPLLAGKKLEYKFGAEQLEVSTPRQLEQLVYGLVDVDFLREILNNLLENAVKYTAEGGAVWVNVRGEADRALISVTDTGMGIAPDDLSHVFRKFYRADSSQTQEVNGTGLGLYLVQQRAKAMGGRVWAESTLGEGSTFYVSLPRLTPKEYERHLLIWQNQESMRQAAG